LKPIVAVIPVAEAEAEAKAKGQNGHGLYVCRLVWRRARDTDEILSSVWIVRMNAIEVHTDVNFCGSTAATTSVWACVYCAAWDRWHGLPSLRVDPPTVWIMDEILSSVWIVRMNAIGVYIEVNFFGSTAATASVWTYVYCRARYGCNGLARPGVDPAIGGLSMSWFAESSND
jgi:hypothetical protein